MGAFFGRYIGSFKGLSRQVWWLSLMMLINRAGAMVIPFLSLYLTESLSFGLTQVAWIMTAFGAGAVAGSWLGGKLTDRFGFYPVIFCSLALTGALLVVLQYLTTLWGFGLGIFLVSAAADACRPAVFVSLNSYSKPENLTRSITLIRLAINMGFSAGPALGGLIIMAVGYTGLFWVDGLTCLGAGLLFAATLDRKDSKKVKEVSRGETGPSVFSDVPYMFFLLSIAIFCFLFMQYFSTVPLFYKDIFLLTEGQIGILLSMNGGLIFLLEMPLVAYFEKQKRLSRLGILILGSLLLALSFGVLVFSSWAGVLIVGMLFMAVAEMLFFPFSNAMAINRACKGNQGEYMAWYSIAISVSHVAAHNIGMHSVEWWGFGTTWTWMALLSVASGLLLLSLKKALSRKAEVVPSLPVTEK
ncbi:MAG: MFS transporter [Cytophagales bacterium]|nr:MFS transporter [Cytophagales bacterium]